MQGYDDTLFNISNRLQVSIVVDPSSLSGAGANLRLCGCCDFKFYSTPKDVFDAYHILNDPCSSFAYYRRQ
jgi:hypothetical protein